MYRRIISFWISDLAIDSSNSDPYTSNMREAHNIMIPAVNVLIAHDGMIPHRGNDMSQVLESFSFNGDASGSRYPWSLWLDQRIHRITPADFNGKGRPKWFQAQCRLQAKARGLKLRFQADGSDIVLQAYREDAEQPQTPAPETPAAEQPQSPAPQESAVPETSAPQTPAAPPVAAEQPQEAPPATPAEVTTTTTKRRKSHS
jgi:hypothetical protein